MAREAGVKVSNFVPPEAESPADVRGRAISFFKVQKLPFTYVSCFSAKM